MEDKLSKINKFPGFPKEKQTWDFPTVLNGYVHLLSGAQFKVLWYIIRHTYGWQKMEDKISLNQFTNGIKKRKTEEWVDRGIGLSRPQVINSLKKLEEMGFVEVIHKKGKTTTFRPRLVKKFNQTSKESLLVASKETLPTIPNITIPNRQYNNASASEKISSADIVDNLFKKEEKGRINYDFQYLGLDIFEKTTAPEDKRAECIRLAKVCPPGKISASLSFALDYPNKKLRWKMFLWKLNMLLRNEKPCPNNRL